MSHAKKPIAEIFKIFESVRHDMAMSSQDFGDYAAVIVHSGDDVILFAADGIWGRIVEKSPWWTGYTSVV